jgi:4-amino-4-deoxy-L-arabinose transferase-like glycosyltransferase
MAAQHRSRPRIRRAVVFAAIVAAAVAVRVVFLVQIERSELGTVPSVDARFYDELARSLASGANLPPGALTFNPLYPFFLAAVYRLFGAGDLAPRAAQALLGALTIALVYLGALRLVEGPRAGRPPGAATAAIAAGMALLYAPLVLYEGMLLGTTIEVFLFAAALLLSLVLDQTLRGERGVVFGTRAVSARILALILGACCGAGALARPNLFLLLSAALPVWFLARPRRRRRGFETSLVFAAGAALFLLPAVAFNARETGRFVPVSAHGGINFYIGNRPGTAGVYEPPDGMRGDMRGLIEDARIMAETETGGGLTDAQVSDFYMRRALEAIGRDPIRWLGLLARKLALFWNKAEIPDVPSAFLVARSAGVLRLLFLPYAAIAPLAAAGLVALWRSGRNRGIAAIFLAGAVLSVILFFVNARYRLPAVPLLAALAAFFLVWSARELSRGRVRAVAFAAAVGTAVFFLATARTIVRMNDGAAYTILGNHYVETGDEAKAFAAFAEAYRLDPGRIETAINYARVLMRAGDAASAAPLYGRAYAKNPRVPRLAIEYGSALERTGRREEAKRLYEEGAAAGGARERVLACRLLAQAALAEGDRDGAAAWVRRALEVAPGDEELAGMLRWIEEGR